MEDDAFEADGPSSPESPGDQRPPEWAIEAARAELGDAASSADVDRRAFEMVKEEKGA